MAGMVSDRDSASSIRDWQETADLLFAASFVHDHRAAEGADAAVLGDGARVHIGGGLRGAVDHLRAGVQILSLAGEGDAGELHPCALGP